MKAAELAKLIINRSHATGGLITHSKLQLSTRGIIHHG